MENFEDIILSRRSIREYEDKKIPFDIMKKILIAGMAAPSAHNEQARIFHYIDDLDILKELYERHPYGKAFKGAKAAVLVCGDYKKDNNLTFLIQNCAASMQNMSLMAVSNGIGSTYIGVLDNDGALDIVRDILKIDDESVIPIAIMSFGYPNEFKHKRGSFKEELMRYNR